MLIVAGNKKNTCTIVDPGLLMNLATSLAKTSVHLTLLLYFVSLKL